MGYKFNGTTQNASSGEGGVTDCSFTSSAETIDITSADDDSKTFETGVPDSEATVTIIGSTAVAVGDTLALSIAWADDTGSADAMTNAIVTNVETSGSMDGAITSTITLKPTPAA